MKEGAMLEYLKGRAEERDAVVEYLVRLANRWGPFSKRGTLVKSIALDITLGDHVLKPEPKQPEPASTCRCGVPLEPGETECGTCPRGGPERRGVPTHSCSCGNTLQPGETECGPCQSLASARSKPPYSGLRCGVCNWLLREGAVECPNCAEEQAEEFARLLKEKR